MEFLKETHGFLIDLDGVLYVGNTPIEGAREAIAFLKKQGYAFRCVSNTTRKCRQTIAARLSSMGFDIPADHIFTPPLAAVSHMKRSGKTGYHLLATGDVEKDFSGLKRTGYGTKPDWVVVGDAGDNVTYGSLNTAFRFLMDGAEFLALENDRYWMAADGLSLSAGPVVRALEYASGKTALVMGKPSTAFFSLALQDMNLCPDEVVMIGDDIQTDIGGAHHAGMRGILVRTGKYRRDSVVNAPIQPTAIIDSVAHIPEVLNNQGQLLSFPEYKK